MRALALVLSAGLLACGPVTPPGADAGAPGEWSELATLGGLTAPFQALVAQPGAVFALVGEDTVLRSAGGRFELVSAYDSAVVFNLAAAQSGQVAFTVLHWLHVCEANCGSADSYVELSLPRTPIALCGGADGLGVLTTATDAGAALFTQDGGGWSDAQLLAVGAPRACARTRQTVWVTEQGGVFNATTGAVERVDVPGRDGAQEPWRLAGSAGDRVFVVSDLGGAAVRDVNGSWRAWAVTSGDITALAVAADDAAWLASGRSLFRFAESGWVSEGDGPAALTSVAGLALQPAAIYAGGVDAEGRPRIFRRTR